MPDWKDIVRSRMAGLRLPGSVREDVIAEIAAHLQEVHDDATARGFSATGATELALQEVTDWRTLSIQITQAKHSGGPHEPSHKEFLAARFDHPAGSERDFDDVSVLRNAAASGVGW
jgi:hypothetical protein